MEDQDYNKNREKALQKALNEKGKHIAVFFESDDFFVYCYKKTERLIMATYMVTDIMSDSEPIKSHVRESSLGLLSAVLLLKDESSLGKAVRDVHEVVLQVVSLLDVAYVTGRVTEMNASVLKREFKDLLQYINSFVEERRAAGGSSSIPSSLFDIDEKEKESPIKERSLTQVRDTTRASGLKQFIEKEDRDKTKQNPSSSVAKKKSHSRPSGYIGNVAKNERRAAIFNLLREKKEITVRDLASVVTDCSEKTLQRELLQLVEEGILNKEGERRWSRYSLVI